MKIKARCLIWVCLMVLLQEKPLPTQGPTDRVAQGLGQGGEPVTPKKKKVAVEVKE